MRVEMRPAYQWTCDNCGKEQFESAVICEMSDDDFIEAAIEHGVAGEDDELSAEEIGGAFVSFPESVTCAVCDSTFETIAFDEYDDEDLDEDDEL